MAERAKPKREDAAFVEERDGVVVVTWPAKRYRFLLSDGRVVDVVAQRDDSDLRAVLLAFVHKADGLTKAAANDLRIEGVAEVEP